MLVIVSVNDVDSRSQVLEIGLWYVVLNEYSKLSLEYLRGEEKYLWVGWAISRIIRWEFP